MSGPALCPHCQSGNISAHCNASPTCNWWRCGACAAYGDHRRWAWKGSNDRERGTSGEFG